MIRKTLISISILFLLISNSFAAGSSGGSESEGSSKSKMISKYDQAIKKIEYAKKLEKKGKTKKATKTYTKAQKLLLESNKSKPNKPDTLNYLGFTTRKIGDFENGEKYYLEGLAIDPDHIGINEYLGELYVATNRHNLAVERLEVLKACNCKEYDELKAIIAGEKVSKY